MAIHWDYYCNPQTNENSENGGALTTPEEELAAFDEIFAYLWHQYGISHCIETEPAIPSKYACMYHSRRADTFIPDRITNRNRRFGATEYGWDEDRLEFVGYAPVAKTGYVKPFSKVRENFYKYMLVYAFHQKTQDFDSQVQEGVTLHRNVDLQNSAIIGDRFVPQVGCGCRVIAYSEKGSYERWALPKSWHGLQWADIYLLDAEFDPKLITEHLAISETIHFNIPTDTAYVIVPHNYHPTPTRLSFDDLNGCTIIENYGGIFWGKVGEAKFQTQARGPGGTAGGMGTVTIYLSDTQNEADTNIRFLDKAILHSFRIGNKGGEGMITMISSTEGNVRFSFPLPTAGRTAFIETNWQLPEKHSIRLVLQCSTGVHNILFDDFVYGLVKS